MGIGKQTTSRFSPASLLRMLILWRSQVPVFFGPCDSVSPSVVLDRSYSISILPRADAIVAASGAESQVISVFTDGSKTVSGSGAGFISWCGPSFLGEGSYSLGSTPSVFQCELFAIARACDFLLSSGASPPSTPSVLL